MAAKLEYPVRSELRETEHVESVILDNNGENVNLHDVAKTLNNLHSFEERGVGIIIHEIDKVLNVYPTVKAATYYEPIQRMALAIMERLKNELDKSA